jgi:hypothetical protein
VAARAADETAAKAEEGETSGATPDVDWASDWERTGMMSERRLPGTHRHGSRGGHAILSALWGRRRDAGASRQPAESRTSPGSRPSPTAAPSSGRTR